MVCIMKYKLKKDLPFAKAGDNTVQVEKHSLNSEFLVKYADANNKYYSCVIPLNNAHLWIEEVKPREWYELIDKEDTMRHSLRFKTYAEAKQVAKGSNLFPEELEVIKVREVL